jgi:DNA-binding HxlR family transcriptional regulator
MSAETDPQPAPDHAGCCPLYHEAIELIGKRWTGAILQTLMAGPLRFSQISGAIPDLSDRLLSERMKELETRGLVARDVTPGPPVRVRYDLTPMARELAPALSEIETWRPCPGTFSEPTRRKVVSRPRAVGRRVPRQRSDLHRARHRAA